ncbi:54S ribosomal protein L8, mitochondrial [Daldinia childiae]|uniref:54S ribosomal protein L8, mitochondrial n=1 Tax=Daldinia childiae TaxID=326645 RepID=UPI001446997C|nr:54S ribosomal protein L8, mitochondrial [Daldinia childiae]KAF3057985.1 54S ribosomal protein L8, mitochondrial [Daldinia childiae]
MAGGLVKYRHLSRKSSHRQALLRNLVTALVQHESVRTTWPKAKETQRLAEKLITLAKTNNETSRRKATGILFTPHNLLPKLFGELRQRYASRPGGYTRVLRTEPKSRYDQGDSAILELVDGPKDLRFAMTAAAFAREQRLGRPHNALTLLNRQKVTRFRPGGQAAFDEMVKRVEGLRLGVKGAAGQGAGAQGQGEAPAS